MPPRSQNWSPGHTHLWERDEKHSSGSPQSEEAKNPSMRKGPDSNGTKLPCRVSVSQGCSDLNSRVDCRLDAKYFK